MLSFFRDDVTRPRVLATNPEFRVEVCALPGQHTVVVKRGRLFSKMPLPDHGGLVARLVHLDGKVLPLRRQSSIEIQHPVGLRVLPGHDAGAAGRADGVVAEHPVKTHAVPCQPVDYRGRIQGCKPTTIGANGLRCMVIRHNEQDVRRTHRSLLQVRCDSASSGRNHKRDEGYGIGE